MMWWSDYWWDYAPMPWMFFGPIVMIVFAVICLAMMIFMMRAGMRHRRGGHSVDILKERYARGEISQAEFEERRHILEA
jgi:putative membrane protein